MKRGSGCCAVDIYCTAASTSFSDSISYITYLFSEWRIGENKFEINYQSYPTEHAKCPSESMYNVETSQKRRPLLSN